MNSERPEINPLKEYFHEGKLRKPGETYATSRSEANIRCNLLKDAEFVVEKPKVKRDPKPKAKAPEKPAAKEPAKELSPEKSNKYKTRALTAGRTKDSE